MFHSIHGDELPLLPYHAHVTRYTLNYEQTDHCKSVALNEGHLISCYSRYLAFTTPNIGVVYRLSYTCISIATGGDGLLVHAL